MGIDFAMCPPGVSRDLSVSLATGAPTSIDGTHVHSLIIPMPSNSSVDPVGSLATLNRAVTWDRPTTGPSPASSLISTSHAGV